MYIKLNNNNVMVNTVKDGDRLCISLYGIQNISEVFSAFQPESMPEITIYGETGKTMEIFANHKVTGLHVIGEGVIQIDLQVDPLEIGKAVELAEELEAQKENVSMSEYVIDEILAMLAAHEERLSALEPSEYEEEPEIEDEGGTVE